MKVKVISYFFILILGLFPAQKAHASWYTGAKTLLSSGIQWVKSNLMRSSKPVVQKRNILMPDTFKGLHSAFKPEFAHLSPLTGAALMPNFTNLYLHGSPDSAFTKLLKDPSYGLFHHTDNGLHPTNNKTIPASSWGPTFLGTLAADIHLNRVQDPDWVKKEFIPQAKKSHTDAFGKRGNVSTTRIEATAQALAESQKEMIDTAEKAALYPRYYLPAVPAAILMHKAKTKSDAADYVQALHNRLRANGAESPLKKPETFFTEPEQRTVFSGTDFKQSLEQPIDRVVTDEETFETRFAAETDRRLNGSIIPQQVKQMRYGYKGHHEVPNCSETALQDLCNIILAGIDGTFDLSILPLQPLEKFREFYTNYGSYKAINDHGTGQAWMNLVSGHKGIKYYQEDAQYEIRSYLDNLLHMLNILFGTSAQSYAEFGKQISTEQRTVKAEIIEEDKRVCFTISLKRETVKAFLCVNPGRHSWLEVPDREDKNGNTGNTPWVNDLAQMLNKEKISSHERLNAELLLPLRQNVSLNEIKRRQFDGKYELLSKFKPKTVAQATHIAYATAENAEKPYNLFLDTLVRGKDEREAFATLSTIIGSERNKTDSNDFFQLLIDTAFISDDTTLIKTLISKGIPLDKLINRTRICEMPLLIFHTGQDNFAMCKFLLEHGADVNDKDEYGDTALMDAVRLNNFKISKLLIEHGADVHSKDKFGHTPLIRAMHFDMIKLLLEHGANVHDKDIVGYTPLMLAVRCDNLDQCKLLIEHGADINARDLEGNTPLMHACSRSYETCKLLIEHGADIHTRNEAGETPLMKAANAWDGNDRYICKLLIKHGADVNARSKKGDTPLSLAKCRPSIRALLIKNGAIRNRKKSRPTW